MHNIEETKQILRTAINDSILDSKIRLDMFFMNWFRFRLDQAYYFLFKKNLSVTNLQYAELVQLVKKYTVYYANNKSSKIVNTKNLQIVTISEFKSTMNNLLQSFFESELVCRDDVRINEVVELYATLASHTIVMHPLYGSCAVFVPPNLKVDINSVCAYSGYIHSCGYNVYMRNVDKASHKDLITALNKRINKNQKKVLLIIYAHEDFTEYDREKSSELKSGLDDVKIYIEKYYMQNTPLTDVVRELLKEFGSKIIIPPPGNFSNELNKIVKKENELDRSKAFWLIVDNSIDFECLAKGGDRYYICYEQMIKNENPFHIFDENKPGWISHTTTPHTLVGSLINICRNIKNKRVCVCDPFSGTGTTMLESVKYRDVISFSSDISPISEFTIKYNLEFFSLALDEIKSIGENLKLFCDNMNEIHLNKPTSMENNKSGLTSMIDKSKTAESVHIEYLQNGDEIGISSLENLCIIEKLFFYLYVRCSERHGRAFERGSEEWNNAFKIEILTLIKQINEYKDFLKSSAIETRLHEFENICVFQGKYSKSCSIKPEMIKKEKNNLVKNVKAYCVSELVEKSHDVIIIDPPYGINKNMNVIELANLYKMMLGKVILSLKTNGELFIILPDRTHNGKLSPFFTHHEIVTRMVLLEAENQEKRVVINAEVVPEIPKIFSFPFYWESEKALRRAILYFNFT